MDFNDLLFFELQIINYIVMELIFLVIGNLLIWIINYQTK